MSLPRFFQHELSAECDWCHGTGVGTDESGRCYNPGCGSSGRVSWNEERPEPQAADVAFFTALGDVLGRAEALGLEAHRALTPWGAKPIARATWARQAFEVEALFVPPECWTIEYVLAEPPPRARSMLPHLQRQASAFRSAAARKVLVPARLEAQKLTLPPTVAGRGFHELEDPFAPMLELLALGVALTGASEQLRFWCPPRRL
jgi:hypothetical protein